MDDDKPATDTPVADAAKTTTKVVHQTTSTSDISDDDTSGDNSGSPSAVEDLNAPPQPVQTRLGRVVCKPSRFADFITAILPIIAAQNSKRRQPGTWQDS